MKKILLFAVLLLTLTLLPTVSIVAKKPHPPGDGKPPREEAYYVTIYGDDITSDKHKLMRRRAHGGKHRDLINFPGEYSYLTFIGDDLWGVWKGSHKGKLGIWIDLKTKKVGMSYQFDFTHEPLNFWVLESTYEGIGEWIPYDAGMQVDFYDDPFELWQYRDQGDITTLRLTFSVTIIEA